MNDLNATRTEMRDLFCSVWTKNRSEISLDNTPGENDSLHEKSIELAQLLLDHVIDCFYYNPFLTNADKLFLVHEYRRLIDDAEQMLISSPDRPFHVDGHKDRMNDLHRQIQEEIKKTGREGKSLNT